jgi:hypothetical protein
MLLKQGAERRDSMRLRTVCLKVVDMGDALAFWSALFQREPLKHSARWSEFVLGDVRIGLLFNDFGETTPGQGCVPVFELDNGEVDRLLERALQLGATVVFDGLADPAMNGIVLSSPGGQEFELHRA